MAWKSSASKARTHCSKPQQTNYLASVSDLMSALLFVFILTLAVAIVQARLVSHQATQAASNLAKAEAEARSAAARLESVQERLTAVESRLAGNQEATERLLKRLQAALAERGIPVAIDASTAVLRIPESAVTFEVGKSRLDDDNAGKVRTIGEVLARELVCYQIIRPADLQENCRESNRFGHTLDAVFIEGHTDNQAYRGDATGRRNRALSTARSNEVYDLMVIGNEKLASLANAQGESLFSLSGYGAERPLPGHSHAEPTDDSANRRIELRFILTPPSITHDEKALISARPEDLP